MSSGPSQTTAMPFGTLCAFCFYQWACDDCYRGKVVKPETYRSVNVEEAAGFHPRHPGISIMNVQYSRY